MGYASIMTINVQIPPKKIEIFRQVIRDIPQEELEIFCDELSVDDDGYLEYCDYYQKWHKTDSFAAFLAPFVTDGNLFFVGEDGYRWGYEFKNGKAYHLIFTMERGSVL